MNLFYQVHSIPVQQFSKFVDPKYDLKRFKPKIATEKQCKKLNIKLDFITRK